MILCLSTVQTHSIDLSSRSRDVKIRVVVVCFVLA